MLAICGWLLCPSVAGDQTDPSQAGWSSLQSLFCRAHQANLTFSVTSWPPALASVPRGQDGSPAWTEVVSFFTEKLIPREVRLAEPGTLGVLEMGFRVSSAAFAIEAFKHTHAFADPVF